MKIGLTGSSGILGSSLLKILKNKDINNFKGRVENIKHIEEWIFKNDFDVILHFAAIVPTNVVDSNKKKALHVNYHGTKNIVDSINKFSKKKIWLFYSSTSHVYNFNKNKRKEKHSTNPISYYGETKLLGEQYILNNQFKIIACVGRIFSFTSYKQNKNFIIPAIISKLKNKIQTIDLQNLNHIRDFLPIEDIINAVKFLLNKKTSGVYNICSSQKTNLKHLTLELNKNYKKKLTFSNNKKTTTLFGCNNKISNLGWKPSKINYTNYLLEKYFIKNFFN